MASRTQNQTISQEAKASAILPAIVTRRFSMADLEPLGVWLHSRLKDRWVTLTERMFPTFVKDWMSSNEYLFICTKNAVGLAQAFRDPMNPQIHVREIFVFIKDEHFDDGLAIYPEFLKWAQGMGAEELIVCKDSDIPLQMIKDVIGPVKTRSSHYVKIG